MLLVFHYIRIYIRNLSGSYIFVDFNNQSYLWGKIVVSESIIANQADNVKVCG